MLFKKITEIDINNKILFLRLDLNVPIKNDEITDITRIKVSLTTIEYALSQNAKIIIATHLGRPQEGICNKEDSVKIVAAKLSQMLEIDIPLVTDIFQKIDFTNTKVVMLENVRCNVGEKSNSDSLAQKYAKLCDIFVHDAFATAHRQEASTDAIAKYVNISCAGLLMVDELTALNRALAKPSRPVVAVIGGAKVSTKLLVLENLASKIDYLVVGGGILNTFLAAKGINIGKSLYEKELLNSARRIMQKVTVVLPQASVIVSKTITNDAVAITREMDKIASDEMIVDIGNDFAQEIIEIIDNSQTIIWNGPLGIFEIEQFAMGTKIVATAIANSKAYSLAGGGDTIAAINKFNLFKQIDYVSTAGGALLEYLEGRELPALKILKR